MRGLFALILSVASLFTPFTPEPQVQVADQVWPPSGTLRPGEDVTAPVLVHETKPNYTGEAMRARIQGLVELECVVQVDGSVGQVRVTRSLDSVYGLDQQSASTLKQWRFRPGLKDGMPVPVVISVQMSYTLGSANGTGPSGATPLTPALFNGDALVPLGWPNAFGADRRADAVDPTVIASVIQMPDAFPASSLGVRISYSRAWSVTQSGNGLTLYSNDANGIRSLTISPPAPSTFTLDQPLSRQALDQFTLAAGLGPSFLNQPRLVKSGQVARPGGLWIWFEITAPSFASWNAPSPLADRLGSGYSGIHVWTFATTAMGETISAFCSVIHRTELSDAEREEEIRRAGAEFGDVLRSVVIYQR
jgi:TonB family protein